MRCVAACFGRLRALLIRATEPERFSGNKIGDKMIQRNTTVKFLGFGKGTNRRAGIVPIGATGTVRAVRGREFLVEWNVPDPHRRGNLFNWHMSGSVKVVPVEEDWYEPSYVQ